MKYLTLLVFVLLIGCEKNTGKQTERSLWLDIEFPKALRSPVSRFEQFERRAEGMEVQVQTQGGYQNTFFVPVADWESVALVEIPFPQSESDSLKVEIRVWDTLEDGQSRRYPVASGSGLLKADAVESQGETRLLVKLSLQVSVTEFDV